MEATNIQKALFYIFGRITPIDPCTANISKKKRNICKNKTSELGHETPDTFYHPLLREQFFHAHNKKKFYGYFLHTYQITQTIYNQERHIDSAGFTFNICFILFSCQKLANCLDKHQYFYITPFSLQQKQTSLLFNVIM